MAKNPPEAGLEKWQLRKLRELGITQWKDADDAMDKLKTAMQARARANEKKGGFAAVDAKANTDKTAPDKTPPTTTAEVRSVEVLPAQQNVDVTAPVINVHVPAPGVTVVGDTFKWYPTLCACWNWAQAAVIGASIYAALSSRLSDVVLSSLVR